MRRTATKPPFAEADYLAANPDVAAAIADGAFASGRQHWDMFGQAECRPLDPALVVGRSRRDKLLAGLDPKSQVGVEIGPLTAPLVTKDEGTIFYVDHADTETLRRKYAPTEISYDQVVHVDMVWGERSLQDCLGPDRKVDYVLNSHVIEHVPDVVTWLQEIHAILKPDGSLRMAIPDRRFTFDVLRRESTLADALDAFLRRARTPLPRAILDHFLNVTTVDLGRAWRGELQAAELEPSHSPQWAFELAREFFRTGHYMDTHCWVFTPHSFATLGADLARLGLLHLACERIDPTGYMELEFFACLRPASDVAACAASWQTEADRLAALPMPSS